MFYTKLLNKQYTNEDEHNIEDIVNFALRFKLLLQINTMYFKHKESIEEEIERN